MAFKYICSECGHEAEKLNLKQRSDIKEITKGKPAWICRKCNSLRSRRGVEIKREGENRW